jgi:hypothetical protein
MQLAVNTVVVIVLGMVMVSTGIYFLQQITSVEEEINDISPGKKETILNNRPRGDEVYIHDSSITLQDNAVPVALAVTNRRGNNLSPSFEVNCISCGGTTIEFAYNERKIRPGNTVVMQGLISNKTWSPGQHTLVFNVTNQTGGSIGAETVIAQK